MSRRTACRLLLGLLVGGAACNPSPPAEPVKLPLNRFPGKGGKGGKQIEAKK